MYDSILTEFRDAFSVDARFEAFNQWQHINEVICPALRTQHALY